MTTDDRRKEPHILLAEGDISPWVITCGDPDRAKQISKKCTKVKQLAWNREYRSFRGQYRGQDLTIISHGVGASGAVICFEELVNIGARVIIRVGTCGGLQDGIEPGHIIVGHGAVRDEGTSERMIHLGFPAVADPDIVVTMEAAARKLGHDFTRGILVSTDLYYPSVLPSRLSDYARAGAAGIEMEASALFVLGSIRRIRTGAIAAVDGKPLVPGTLVPHSEVVAEGKKRMIDIAILTMANLAKAGIR